MSDTTGQGRSWGLEDRRLYLCTPDRGDLERFVEACIGGGVDVVQLREKHLSEVRLASRASVVQRVCAAHNVPFVLNDNPELAAAIGADGVHVGQDDMSPVAARQVMGDGAIIGLSTHAPEELEAAIGSGGAGGDPLSGVGAAGSRAAGSPGAGAAGAGAGVVPAPIDYISAGPVVATPSKPGRPGTGLGYVSEAVRRARWPVWITGGADPETVVDMVGAGASHFVVVRWLTEATDPGANARALRQSIDEALERARS